MWRRTWPGLAVLLSLSLIIVGSSRALWTPRDPLAGTRTATAFGSNQSTPSAREITGLFVGDSYVAGAGAETSSERWTTVVSEELSWTEFNRGLGGTGYVATSGPDGCGRAFCPDFKENMHLAKKNSEVDVVIIAGGQNDLNAFERDPEKVIAAVHATFKIARTDFPDAQIVAVGPSVPGNVDYAVLNMDNAVQSAARSVGAEYVSLLEPPVLEASMVLEDGAHVGSAGHAAIAERVLSVVHG